jgi:(S)-3,5-dihydroxyphenylglycine transaminase
VLTTDRQQAVPLRVEDLFGGLTDPVLTSMTFLNEVAGRFPDAISFAAGRPFEGFFDTETIHRHLRTFCDHLRQARGYDESAVRRALLQYGPTKGLVANLVADNLAVDENVHVDAESIVVTVGCQEAMFLVLRALRASERDVLVAVRPNYVGLTGAARLVDMPVLDVTGGPDGIDLDDLVTVVESARAAGLRPRACYVIPDFANPSGVSMSRSVRERLLALADELDLLVLEDNPYGLFHGDAERLPTLKALDHSRRVVYLGSYAKTTMPGARVGYVVADQRVIGRSGGGHTVLADELAKIKSMVTVNTSPICQAVIGGALLAADCSLIAANAELTRLYRDNLRHTLDGLAARFPRDGGVRWNAPTGGFFVVLTVGFGVDDQRLEYSAREHGVIWTPMHHFYTGDGGGRQMRLSVSALTPEQIDVGLDRLAAFIGASDVPAVGSIP